jgi:membrane protease YdiL (CAAX protease family)
MLCIPAALFVCLQVLNNVFLTFLVYYAGFGILVPAIDILIIKKEDFAVLLRYLGISVNKKAVATGIITGVIIYTVIVCGAFFLRSLFFRDNTIVATIGKWGITSNKVVFIFIIMLVCNGCMEEVLWRGYIHKRFSGMQNRLLAILLVNIVFAGQHVFIVMSFITNALTVCLFVLAVFAGGMIWGVAREKTGSAIAPIISHMCATAGYMTVFYLYILSA